MTRQQRMRAARAAGSTGRNPTVPPPLTERGAPSTPNDSHSDEMAASSESSASRPEGTRSGQAASAGPSTRSGQSSGQAASAGEGGLADYTWYGEFLELGERYRWQVAAYIAWAASPVRGRLPKTQAELATLLGYRTDRTIRKWREEQPAIEEEIKARQAGPLWRHRRDLFEALVNVAVAGDVGGLRLAFEMTGDYEPRRVPVAVAVAITPYSADELAAAEAELGDWLPVVSAEITILEESETNQ